MKNRIKISFILALCFYAIGAQGQNFTFECVCAHVGNDTCDICPLVTGLQTRSFHGLLVRRNGKPYRWIDEPYTVKKFNNETIEFVELLPNPDKIIIALFQTPYTTMQGFADSTNCECNAGGGMARVEVDTPIIGDGSASNPIRIGQFGADTTMFLNWNGSHWYPDKIDFSDLALNLPYYASDSLALAGGLSIGDPYLLECDNAYTLPAGLFKVVKICGWNCMLPIEFYDSDASAITGGVPNGKEYALSQVNKYGTLYGFVSAVTIGVVAAPALNCSTSRPYYTSDAAAISGGRAIGDTYNMAAANLYGAPRGTQRVVSNNATTVGDQPTCCSESSNPPYHPNDATAITAGLSVGRYYYLSASNTLGLKAGTKKQIQ
ncbi:MAG: hypothetical protein ACRCVX_14190 [Shewanella sp.]